MTNAWFGDWRERVKNRVRAQGFESATALADSQPTASLITLAQKLARDRDIAAVQLQKLLIAEAEETRTIERCARGLLVRELHVELPEGWHTEWDDNSAFRRAGAFGDWSAALGARYEPAVYRTWDALRATPIPAGWLPDGPDDPILVELFGRHWMTPSVSSSR